MGDVEAAPETSLATTQKFLFVARRVRRVGGDRPDSGPKSYHKSTMAERLAPFARPESTISGTDGELILLLRFLPRFLFSDGSITDRPHCRQRRQ